ncbi:putative glutathione synthase [Rosa chinensis]|uniref:Glutathione synthetase n=1 Tax=Rosa chinensis TaxID=74649 RepID=A0A2P6R6Q8_ROSCH|nr:putative glutathione synthase [Rosa chinensis]
MYKSHFKGVMGASHSIPLTTDAITLLHSNPRTTLFSQSTQSRLQNPVFKSNPTNQIFKAQLKTMSQPSQVVPVNGGKVVVRETQDESSTWPINVDGIDQEVVDKMVYDALVWSSIHGLVVGDRSVQRSSTVPGVGLVHAPFALLPMPFPATQLNQANELAPIFNELVDRVSLDAKFLQDSLSRTKKADPFTSRLLDIHAKMLEINKKEEIRLGLHRSDYMLDEQTKLLLQIEMNTISSSFAGLSGLVGKLHRSLLSNYGEFLGLDSKRIPDNAAVSQFSMALARAWTEYNNPRAVVLFVVQAEERNMYDQHWLSTTLKEKYPLLFSIYCIKKFVCYGTLISICPCETEDNKYKSFCIGFIETSKIDAEAELLPDGTLVMGGQVIGIVYFRAGYTPNDYPSEAEWRARLLMEQSSAIKCPSISYHLVGTKKVQQELAKPNVLERFLDDKEDIAKLRKCFAGLWSLDDSDIVKKAIEKPELFVMKPQREGGGNNIYGNDVRETLIKLQKEGSEAEAAYILMQRLFPAVSTTFLMREGICYKDDTISELGVYGAYLRNNEKVILNDQCGYLMRTKVSSSDEGGVAAGFAVLDSLYLT